MIILPPEEPKKTSPFVKWTFRILLIIVLIGCFGLLSLNLLSGTTDAHKNGLEKAFSNMFKVPVTIGELKTFNIFPKVLIEVKDVRALKGSDGGEVRIESLTLGFRFFDILFGRDLIENLQATNITITADVIGSHGMRIEKAGIVPASEGRAPAFMIKGLYGGLPFLVSLDVQNVGGYQPVYRVEKDLPAEFDLGTLKAQGKFTQNEKGEPSIHTASFKIDDKEIAKGTLTFQSFDPQMGVKLDFETPRSKGQWVGYKDDHTQTWSFEHLDLADILAEEAIWPQIAKALHKPVPGSRLHQEADSVSVTIKSLSGDITGNDIQGRFILKSDKLLGWWSGALTALPKAKKTMPDAGDVKCGLLGMHSLEGTWESNVSLVQIGNTTIANTLRITPESRKITFAVDRLANGVTQTFGKNLSEFKAEKTALMIPEGHFCDALIGATATP